MILCDKEIREAISGGEIVIFPTPELTQYGPSSLDLMLGEEVKQLKTVSELSQQEPRGVQRPVDVDLANVEIRDLVTRYSKDITKREDGSFILEPQKFILGVTRERIELPRESKIAARVEGRSTLARLGLVVHFTAPTIHASFRGHIVLEMCNFGPYNLVLAPGKLYICQLVFERVGKVPDADLKSASQDQTHA